MSDSSDLIVASINVHQFWRTHDPNFMSVHTQREENLVYSTHCL